MSHTSLKASWFSNRSWDGRCGEGWRVLTCLREGVLWQGPSAACTTAGCVCPGKGQTKWLWETAAQHCDPIFRINWDVELNWGVKKKEGLSLCLVQSSRGRKGVKDTPLFLNSNLVMKQLWPDIYCEKVKLFHSRSCGNAPICSLGWQVKWVFILTHFAVPTKNGKTGLISGCLHHSWQKLNVFSVEVPCVYLKRVGGLGYSQWALFSFTGDNICHWWC